MPTSAGAEAMARHYYLTRSGRLRRKDNTLSFEPAGEEQRDVEACTQGEEEGPAVEALAAAEIGAVACEGMGDLDWEPEAAEGADNLTADVERAVASEEENERPVSVRERRTIPVEDVDALWVFGELDLNA